MLAGCPPDGFGGPLDPAVRVSVKLGIGIEDLIRAIHQVCNVAEFDWRTAAFTDRQRHLLERPSNAKGRQETRRSVEELLHG